MLDQFENEPKKNISRKWTKGDILRVERMNMKDGDNHLPKTRRYAETPTWQFYERFIHILEGDTEFDFDDFDDDDLKKIDWQELKIVTQKMKGEEPEEYIEDLSQEPKRNMDNMEYVRSFLIYNFEEDFGIRDIKN